MKKRFLLSGILLIADGMAMVLFRNFPDFFFPAYRRFSQVWLQILSSISGIVPFSLWDILAVLLLVLFGVSLVYTIYKKRSLPDHFSKVLLTVVCLLSTAMSGWLLNHYAPPLADYLDLPVNAYSKSSLYNATEYYLVKAGEYALVMDRDENYHVKDPDFYVLAEKAGAAYGRLEEAYPVFKGSKVRVKRFSLIGDYLLYNGIVGMFMPLSGEAGCTGSCSGGAFAFSHVS